MSAKDPFAEKPTLLDSPARHAAAVTPNNDTELSQYARSLHVGIGGTLRVLTVSDEDVTFEHVVGILPLCVKKVFATGTSATGIVALW
jgi:hypothetical protein